MPLSKSLASYADVPQVLDPIVKAGGGTYRLPTARMATAWRQRAYYYRTLLRRELARTTNLKNYSPPTPYDSLTIFQDGALLTLKLGVEIAGEITLADGTVHVPSSSASVPEADDPLLRAAMDLANLKADG